MLLENLNQFLKNLPTDPGIYQMMNTHRKVIYIGKAKNLKKRVSSYFHRSLDNKTQAMIADVEHIEVMLTSNENEALLLEANLIKEYQPRWNVLLRDDKSYPYIYLNTEHPFPRMDFYRGHRDEKGRYFGPYPSASSVRDNLALIQKLFLIRQCEDNFFNHRSRPCLQYQIKRCTAPCVNNVTEKEYAEQIEHAVLFLEGKNQKIIDELSEKMQKSSTQKQYEQAAHYRDQIAQLRSFQREQFVVVGHDNIDVIGVVKLSGEIVVNILMIRGGRLIGQSHYFPNTPVDTDLSTALSAFIPQYYLNPERENDIPNKIIVSELLTDKQWISNALSSQIKQKFRLIDRELAAYQNWKNMAVNNAKQLLLQHLNQRDNVSFKLEALQNVLKLSNPLERIECFDISHTMGEAIVASCVVYGAEGALKSDYRRFNIQNITPGDDYAAMRQALMRHYTSIKEKGKPLPDLLMIDGGLGQLHQAADVLEELQISGVVLLGVAKGVMRKVGLEKLILWEGKKVFQLKPSDPALHLIQYIRDEAHRFAISAHRRQRDKKRRQSALESIPGVGPKRRQQLLSHFGGLQELQKASVNEIGRVSGISATLSQKIYEAIRKELNKNS